MELSCKQHHILLNHLCYGVPRILLEKELFPNLLYNFTQQYLLQLLKANILRTFHVPSSQLVLIKHWHGKLYCANLRDRKANFEEIMHLDQEYKASE